MLPIHFVVGPHRSGTTYLQTLLGCMPNVGTSIETHFFSRIIPYLKKLETKRNKKVSFSDLKYAIIQIMFFGENNIDFWEELETDFKNGGYKAVFYKLLYTMAKKTTAAPKLLIEKTPSHLKVVDNLVELFPKARFVILIRDPRAIAVSFLKYRPVYGKFKRIIYFVHRAFYLRDALSKINYCLKNYHKKVLLIRYEDLIMNREAQLRKVCDFLSIEYITNYEENYYKVVNSIIFPQEVHKLQNKKIYTKFNLFHWVKKLSKIETIVLEFLLQDYLKQYNYSRMYSNFHFPHFLLCSISFFITILRKIKRKVEMLSNLTKKNYNIIDDFTQSGIIRKK